MQNILTVFSIRAYLQNCSTSLIFFHHRFLYYYNKSYTLKLYNMLHYIFLILIIKRIQTLEKRRMKPDKISN